MVLETPRVVVRCPKKCNTAVPSSTSASQRPTSCEPAASTRHYSIVFQMHVSPEAFSFQQSFKTQRVWWGVCKKALRTCKAFSTVEAEPGENGLPVAAILLQPRGLYSLTFTRHRNCPYSIVVVACIVRLIKSRSIPSRKFLLCRNFES